MDRDGKAARKLQHCQPGEYTHVLEAACWWGVGIGSKLSMGTLPLGSPEAAALSGR